MRKSFLYSLGLVVATLVALGLVVLFSASEIKASMLHRDALFFVKRQGLYVIAGVFAAFIFAVIDYRSWRDHWSLTAIPSMVLLVALLAVFLFPAINGSRRWIPLGIINFQPAEFAKFMTVLVISVYLNKFALQFDRFKEGAFFPACLIGIFALPVFFQPDFGSVMVIGGVGFMLIFMSGTKIKHLAPLVILAIAVFAWRVMNTPNRMARLFAFTGITIEGAEDAADSASYQSDMSLVAIYRGGIFGRGLLKSMQKQSYLPEAWTDFILAVGAEELGLIFSVSVIVLFFIFLFLCIRIALASDKLGQLIVMGMAFTIFFPAMFNIGVVCGAFPTKGMALPFFSYGGTHILASFCAIGMIFSVGIHTLKDKHRAFVRKIVKN